MDTLSLYNTVSKLPFGKFIFSKVLAFRAPYFASINPRVSALRSGYCRVEIKDRRAIRNHIGSINAGALCTLSELTGGLALEASIPSALRWIPKGMNVQYTKKATGRLTGMCALDVNSLKAGDVSIPFEIIDASGETVLKTEIQFYISERG